METPPAEAIYHIARDGKVIANYDFVTLFEKYKSKAVLPTDHYITEGVSEWKLVSELTFEFRKYNEELIRMKGQEAEAKENAELENKRIVELALKERKKKWRCITCQHNFKTDESNQKFPEAEGINTAVGYVFLAGILAAFAVGILFSKGEGAIIGFFIFIIGTVVALAVSLGQVISYGVESGLQKFSSYRPCCPQCSSTHCVNQADSRPQTTLGA